MHGTTIRAFAVTGPHQTAVRDIPAPVAGRGEVIVHVERVGVCGTDREFFTGEMAYLATGDASYPVQIGHEWAGIVDELGEGVDGSWLGRRVTGDTMLGCGHCRRCRAGRQHLCAERFEVGIRHGWPGALAERFRVRASSLLALPDSVDAERGALVEPTGNALRAVDAAGVDAGERLLVVGPGTIGLLAAMIARARGVDVELLGHSQSSVEFARGLGFRASAGSPSSGPYHGIVDASTGADIPKLAVDLVEPGRHVALIGIAAKPSTVDSRQLVFKEATAVGILSASPGLPGAIELIASGRIDPLPLVATVVGLEDVEGVLADRPPQGAGPGPKVLVDPSR